MANQTSTKLWCFGLQSHRAPLPEAPDRPGPSGLPDDEDRPWTPERPERLTSGANQRELSPESEAFAESGVLGAWERREGFWKEFLKGFGRVFEKFWKGFEMVRGKRQMF